MIIKILKAEMKDNTRNGCILNIKVETSPTQFKHLTPRKIKNKVANFFGQTFQIPVSNAKTHVQVQEINRNFKTTLILSFCLNQENFSIGENNHGSMMNENQLIKIHWSWHFDNPLSHFQSEKTHDMVNIQTPRNMKMKRQKKQYRFFTPPNQRGRNTSLQSNRTVQSQKDLSINLNKTKDKMYKKKQFHQQRKKDSIKKIQSIATRSKTPTKIAVNQANKKPQNLKNKPIIQGNYKKQSSFKYKTQTLRKYSQNLNGMGTVLATTVGAFAGLISGILTY